MPQSETGLSTRGLSLGYGQRLIVEALDLVVPRGAFTVLLGQNGSGKSTILRALAGLLRPVAGAVLLDGRPIRELSTRDLARRIGVLSQGPSAPEGLTVLDLVRQGRYPHRSIFARWSEADEIACEEALRLTNMGDLRDQRLDSLSGGQRQRAWIAMTLAQETDILLLDEPTTFLDLAHQIEVMDLITELVRTRRKTIVAVLHDLNQASRHADHMVLLKAGRIAGSGKPGDVMTAANIGDVFGVKTVVIADPLTGTPMCVPVPKENAAEDTMAMLR